jgi:hypothetical protein
MNNYQHFIDLFEIYSINGVIIRCFIKKQLMISTSERETPGILYPCFSEKKIGGKSLNHYIYPVLGTAGECFCRLCRTGREESI